jgi:hypothetical protein
MSLLPLPADPGTRQARTAEPWIGPPFYPLDLVERTISILELADELRGRDILTENFISLSHYRRSVLNC